MLIKNILGQKMSNNMHNKLKYFLAIYWVIAFEIISYGMGLIIRSNMDWYKLLNKSIITPPDYIFQTVWIILYAVLAWSAYLLYREREKVKIKQILLLFFLQMLSNCSWTPIFFGLHKINIALGILILTISLTSYILIQSISYCRIVFYLLLPYFCWLLFACHLNLMICILN
uniref:Translocator protein n=1 Tax=Cacopsylla melanoneura TaxID=428564 RepID=A0A8D8VKR9_9HEMI